VGRKSGGNLFWSIFDCQWTSRKNTARAREVKSANKNAKSRNKQILNIYTIIYMVKDISLHHPIHSISSLRIGKPQALGCLLKFNLRLPFRHLRKKMAALAGSKIQAAIAATGSIYVSVTGLLPHSFWHELRFWWYAVPSKMQSDSAEGCLFSDVKTQDGVHHTLTVWESRKKMMAYITSGAHATAMKNFASIGTGSVYGYETTTAPNWDEALALLKEKGRVV
jgi:hypothetical protein